MKPTLFQWAGLKGMKNGALLQAAEGAGYDVFVTLDQGIRCQTAAGRTQMVAEIGGLEIAMQAAKNCRVLRWLVSAFIDHRHEACSFAFPGNNEGDEPRRLQSRALQESTQWLGR
jgi:hypothetical protein